MSVLCVSVFGQAVSFFFFFSGLCCRRASLNICLKKNKVTDVETEGGT